MTDLVPISDIRGPAGYNATNAAEDLATLADYVNETAGENAFSDALKAKFLSGDNQNLVSYAESKSGQISSLSSGSSWTNPPGLMLHVPPTTRDVWFFWHDYLGISYPGQGTIASGMWDITGADTLTLIAPNMIASERLYSNSVATYFLKNQIGFANVKAATTHRMFMLAGKVTQEGSSLAAYFRNGVAGYDHTWAAAVML